MRAWLFRIAHNHCMDRLKSYEHQQVEAMEELPEVARDEAVSDPVSCGRPSSG